MQGAAIYRNDYEQPTILMYKEYYNNLVFILMYVDKKLSYQFITTKLLTEIMPRDCIHVLTELPFSNNINTTISIWRLLIKNKLDNMV
tara:strand:+ start:5221 stop:5484 length:264 start_codon:yes stop_codon:yes gene_type:complete